MKFCQHCNGEMGNGGWRGKRFCSDRCRIEHWRNEHKADAESAAQRAADTKREQLRTRDCWNCGKSVFQNGHQHNKKFCNAACKQQFYRYWKNGGSRTAPRKGKYVPPVEVVAAPEWRSDADAVNAAWAHMVDEETAL